MSKYEKNNEARRKRNALRIALGICRDCKTASIPNNSSRCEKCSEHRRVQNAQYVLNKKTKGHCTNCLNTATIKTSQYHICDLCYCKSVSRSRLGTSNYAQQVLDKLKEQDYKCPYTKIELELGVNCSLDHILPVSRFPDKANDLDNVEWVTRHVNTAKNNMTPEEFISFIKLISANF
jgi:hypothetical protein